MLISDYQWRIIRSAQNSISLAAFTLLFLSFLPFIGFKTLVFELIPSLLEFLLDIWAFGACKDAFLKWLFERSQFIHILGVHVDWINVGILYFLYKLKPVFETGQNGLAVDCKLFLIEFIDSLIDEAIMFLYSQFVPLCVLNWKRTQ